MKQLTMYLPGGEKRKVVLSLFFALLLSLLFALLWVSLITTVIKLLK